MTIRSRTSAFGAARRPSRYGRGMRRIDLQISIDYHWQTNNTTSRRSNNADEGSNDERGATSGHGTAGPRDRDRRGRQRRLPRDVLRRPGAVRDDQRHRQRHRRRLERRARLAAPADRSRSRSAASAVGAAIVGAGLTVAGSTLVVSGTTGFFLAGLVSSVGFAGIGAWLVVLNRSDAMAAVVPPRLRSLGIAAGALMALGIAAAAGHRPRARRHGDRAGLGRGSGSSGGSGRSSPTRPGRSGCRPCRNRVTTAPERSPCPSR